jgi:hypothetical protein
MQAKSIIVDTVESFEEPYYAGADAGACEADGFNHWPIKILIIFYPFPNLWYKESFCVS